MKRELIPAITVAAFCCLVIFSCKSRGTKSDDGSSADGATVSSSPQINLQQEKDEIELAYKRLLPGAHPELGQYPEMAAHLQAMIAAGAELVKIYPERNSELQAWKDLYRRIIRCQDLMRQENR